MTDRASNLVAGICGIVAVLAAEIAFFAVVGTTPELGASTHTIDDFFTRSSTRVYGGGYAVVVAFPLILVFFGRLRELLRRAEGEGGWLATTAFGAAVAAVGLEAVALTAEASAYYAGRHGADATTVAPLIDVDGFAFVLGGIPFAVFLGATAAIVLRTGGLPRWLGWSAAVIAVALPATLWSPKDAAQIPHLLLDLWILAASIVLIRRRELAYVARPAKAQA
ncbi:MAG: hypothetical protein WAQ33_02245 [Gaiellaceae bacterium]